MRFGLIAAVVLTVHAQAQSVQAKAADSVYLHRVMQAEARFFTVWRAAWMAKMDTAIVRSRHAAEAKAAANHAAPAIKSSADLEQLGAYDSTASSDDRVFRFIFGDIHCHWDGTIFTSPRMIRSALPAQAMCPNWLRADMPATSIYLIRPAQRATMTGQVLAARTSALALLDSAAARLPRNAWVAGQRVRMAVDAEDWESAERLARTCSINRWWCSALAGYVFAQRGQLNSADSAFAVATTATGGPARCMWTDTRSLLDARGRAGYGRLSCAAQDSASATLLWLSAPLFSEPVNARRVEHYAREMSVLLHSAIERDETFSWRNQYGGDATAAMIMRYGWPSIIQWGGNDVDGSHETWLLKMGANYRAPYTTAEYTRGRVHLVPAWNAIASPFTAHSTDWDFNGTVASWWPEEHFTPRQPLVQILDDQIALLRRERQALFAYATDLGSVPLRRGGDSVVALLMRTTGPMAIDRVRAQSVSASSRLVFRELLPPQRAVIGVEIPASDTTMPAARTRFGVTPPPTLMSMARGEVAISDPVILEAPTGDAPLPNDPDGALARMLGSTHLAAGTKQVGVYWETYGFTSTDSVEVAVRIQRYTPQGLLRNVGIAMKIATDLNTPVAISWREPDPGHGAFTMAGAVAVVTRSVVLDISGVPPGDYWLDVLVAKPGKAPVSARRAFSIATAR
jgi:hypothetical protein